MLTNYYVKGDEIDFLDSKKPKASNILAEKL